ncbi:MAG: 2-polyprenyl-3-methyl-5-hydroxy-6-metoxy-1,4-benzoquinol methylase [archaeon GW2011_AR10]|uniref:Class I SAM-dependent methyltransferase n=1 Tax=Candidatus Iainarchaeum sp. TaxID=3101447 RepID=A0A7J4IUZ3_9ARCH|nr:MAG: 2-polyprenyl-3-methyl-5-hydroxy-6-metoxy-1,4-benzoquinol methylase [archaeon GW2011_AR10]HIH08045.1 class I SAM-dependent methyltransferase [Candidatus Diapherotrites archaeon]
MSKEKCVCGSASYHLLFRKGPHSIEKCSSCGISRTFPVPKPNYAGEKEKHLNYLLERKKVEGFMEELLEEVKKFKPSGKLLDVGCSVGILLELAERSGYSVKGVEPSRIAAAEAKKALGKKAVKEALFEDSGFPPRYFDLVVFNHVFEHFQEPAAALKEAKRILRKKGVVVIGVPDFESRLAGIKKQNWVYLNPEEHVWHFGHKILPALLSRNGFRVLKVKINKPFFPISLNPFILFDKIFYQFLLNWREGDTIIVIAAKK